MREQREKDLEFKASVAKQDGVPMEPLDKDEEAKFQEEESKFKDGFVDYLQYRSMLPEQLAMIDLYVSRYAPCFCSAHTQSSFSYWVLRMKALSEHKHLSVFDISKDNYGVNWVFGGWGV